MTGDRTRDDVLAAAWGGLAVWAIVTLLALFALSGLVPDWPNIARVALAGAIGLLARLLFARQTSRRAGRA